MGNAQDILDEVKQPARALRDELPSVLDAYGAMGKAVMVDGALDAKCKELLALAIAVSKQCDGCIASHACSAALRGATAEDVPEALDVVVIMNSGAGTVHGPRAFDAFVEFSSR